MKIAIASTTCDPEGKVPDIFAGSPCLLIINALDNKILSCFHNQGDDAALAEQAVLAHCECILCGPIEEEPFNVLADAGLTRYNAAGHTLEDALDDFEQNTLELIRAHINGMGCQGDHRHL